MIPGGPLYVFSIGMGYTGEKLAKNLDQKLQKLEKKIKFELNGALRGAFRGLSSAFEAKFCACFESELRFEPRPCFWPVLKDPDFSKNPDFFNFPGLCGYKIDAAMYWSWAGLGWAGLG